jgi:hypothetical protein
MTDNTVPEIMASSIIDDGSVNLDMFRVFDTQLFLLNAGKSNAAATAVKRLTRKVATTFTNTFGLSGFTEGIAFSKIIRAEGGFSRAIRRSVIALL